MSDQHTPTRCGEGDPVTAKVPYTGDCVSWQWGLGTASGLVKSVMPRKVTRTIKGSRVTRNGSKANPAIVIEQSDGGNVLKLASELV